MNKKITSESKNQTVANEAENYSNELSDKELETVAGGIDDDALDFFNDGIGMFDAANDDVGEVAEDAANDDVEEVVEDAANVDVEEVVEDAANVDSGLGTSIGEDAEVEEAADILLNMGQQGQQGQHDQQEIDAAQALLDLLQQ